MHSVSSGVIPTTLKAMPAVTPTGTIWAHPSGWGNLAIGTARPAILWTSISSLDVSLGGWTIPPAAAATVRSRRGVRRVARQLLLPPPGGKEQYVTDVLGGVKL